tara:strand:+ start:54 stop:476 length:423 start_codon:yes stop_codon:yes gene_type:complete
MRNKMMVFHASAVDANSVTSADDGANLDLAAFDANNITAVAAENNGNGLVYIYFANSNRFEGGPVGSATELLEQAFVRLTCTSGKEADVVKDFLALATAPQVNTTPVPVFDAINSKYPIDNITGMQIRRHNTTVTVASDS